MTSKSSIHQKAAFDLKIRGDISEKWNDWFENVRFHIDEGYIFLQTGPIDQSGLIGLLSNLASLGYFILSVQIKDEHNFDDKYWRKEEVIENNLE